MKGFCFVILLLICFCIATEDKPNLGRITWYGVSYVQNPPTLTIAWDKVMSVDFQDPVIGYKVNIWEVTKIKKILHMFHENGLVERVEVEDYPKPKRINGTNVIPEGKLTILEAPTSNLRVSFGIKLEVPYQFTVTAYTRKMEGPPSAITGVTVFGDDWKSQYEIIIAL